MHAVVEELQVRHAWWPTSAALWDSGIKTGRVLLPGPSPD
jgi:hypothetical protein